MKKYNDPQKALRPSEGVEYEALNETSLIGLDLAELEALVAQWGEPPYRAKQLMTWLYARGVSSFDEMTNLPKAFRQKLETSACIGSVSVLGRTNSMADTATKYLFQLTDGDTVESVLMFEENRTTACVSSQVGCAMACDFCATAKMGFFRNLTTAEILEQLIALQRATAPAITGVAARWGELGQATSITNVVFMGMGEPLANYDHVLKAVRLMAHPNGLNMSEQHITVSTSGLAPRMRQLAHEGLKCRLALSLNGTTDAQRTRLMPINAKYPIDEILDAAREWALATQQPATLEYVLIRDVNDSVADAKRLRKLMGRLPCKLNLIPFNEIEGADFRRPEISRIERFRQIVSEGNHVAPIRFSRGRDIAAACGQLRTVYERRGAMMRADSRVE